MRAHHRWRWVFRILAPTAVLLAPMVGATQASAAPELVAGTYSVSCLYGEVECPASEVPAVGTIQIDGQTYAGLIYEGWDVVVGGGVNVDLILTVGNLQWGCFELYGAPTSSVSGNTITFASPMTCVDLNGTNNPGSPAQLSTTINLYPNGGLTAGFGSGGFFTATYTLTYP